LLAAIEGHWPLERIQSTLVAKFGLSDDQARIAQERAREGVVQAISGNRKNRPDSVSDPIGYATFNMVWNTFKQNGFFDRRRSPSRKWLDWKEQQACRTAAT
jgi:hypothetical protein